MYVYETLECITQILTTMRVHSARYCVNHLRILYKWKLFHSVAKFEFIRQIRSSDPESYGRNEEGIHFIRSSVRLVR